MIFLLLYVYFKIWGTMEVLSSRVKKKKTAIGTYSRIRKIDITYDLSSYQAITGSCGPCHSRQTSTSRREELSRGDLIMASKIVEFFSGKMKMGSCE
jgi:hypothetical protein